MALLNLDTHILIFALEDTLTAAERKLLSENAWGISAIVGWEMAKLAQLGRLSFDLAAPEFTRLLARLHVWPLDAAVCLQSTRLDFRSNPADELIAATSIVHGAPLVTRDRKIRRSRLVPLVAAPQGAPFSRRSAN